MTLDNQVYIGLGSNLEDSVAHVEIALDELQAIAKPATFKSSQLYRSKPLAGMDQPDYINAVAGFQTTLNAHELLAQCQAIENAHGRVRNAERWSARTLDLDILLYGQQIIECDSLTIPHPGLKIRNFVLYPLAELDPELLLPDNSTLHHWLNKCSAEGITIIEHI